MEREQRQVCGMVSLTRAGANTLDKGPFEPELAYATGNLVAISLAKTDDGLTFAGAGWEGVEVDIGSESKNKPAVASVAAAQLSFRIADVPVLFGSGRCKSGKTTLRLGLTTSDTAAASGLPQFSAATLMRRAVRPAGGVRGRKGHHRGGRDHRDFPRAEPAPATSRTPAACS